MTINALVDVWNCNTTLATRRKITAQHSSIGEYEPEGKDWAASYVERVGHYLLANDVDTDDKVSNSSQCLWSQDISVDQKPGGS